MSQKPLARLVLFAFPLLALLLATACGGESGLYDAVYRVGFEEGYITGYSECSALRPDDYEYEYDGEDEYRGGYFNGFGDGFYEGYQDCAGGKDAQHEGEGPLFNPDPYDAGCLEEKLGSQATLQIMDRVRIPTPRERERVQDCLLTERAEEPEKMDKPETEDGEEEGGEEDTYGEGYKQGYAEGFTEGSARCKQGKEPDYEYEYQGENEHKMGYYNGYGEAYYDGYDACADAGEHGTDIDDVEAEEPQEGAEEEDETPQRQDDLAVGQTSPSTQTTATEAAPVLIVAPPAETSGAGWNYRSAAENERALSPPDADAIRVDYDAGSGQARLTAATWAVPARAMLVVANLELGDAKLLRADASGAFETQIAAFPGTHIMVKQDSTGEVIRMDWGDSGIFEQDSIQSPGILLRVPQLTPQEIVNGFTVAGGARVTDSGPAWVFAGSISEINLQPGDAFSVAGRITVLSDAASLEKATLSYSGQLLGDENGHQIGPAGEFLSNLLTPTGLPIERSSAKDPLAIFPQDCERQPLPWQLQNGHLVADYSCQVQVSGDAPAGTYAIWLTLNTPEDARQQLQDAQQDELFRWGRDLGQNNSIALATVSVDAAAPMRLTTTLLADLLQEGTRGGVLAREDTERMAIGSRIITEHSPVVPRTDAFGDPWRHRLDPYALLLGITDRAPPAVPFITFDFTRSELEITVERPDGMTDVLGPAPLAGYGIKTPALPGGNKIAGGGGHIGEIPQLLGHRDTFSYQFPLDGDYVVRLQGYITDANGKPFEITGTYDVTVANSLDIETTLLPGTPFEVGDSLPIGLQVFPGVPADINLMVTHVDPANTVTTQQFAGKANADGWWDGDGQSFLFDSAGEYLLRVEARYLHDDAALWAGRMKYGGVVATPDGPMKARGVRGSDSVEAISPPWGFGRDFPPDGHLQLPYFPGDILWGMEGPEKDRVTENTSEDHFLTHGPGDSVNLVLSMHAVDENHPLVARALGTVARFDDYHDLLQAGQLPIWTTPKRDQPTGGSWGWESHPEEEVSLLTYGYASAQRPGVRVRETVGGEMYGPSSYWRFQDAYHMQSGNSPFDGDQPGDFKFLYGGVVIRDLAAQTGVFAIYSSGWVLTHDDDPLGSRFMPPFQGNAGGPNGGPLFTVHGHEIDMFFLPLGVRPGAVLEVGDLFRMAGPIMPTLPSMVEYTVTAPDGTTLAFDGRANTVGYFYDPAADFVLDQPGLWTVDLTVTHDGMTSAGPVGEPYPSGGPLTPDGNTFTFVVIDNETQPLYLSTDLARIKPSQWYTGTQNARFEALLPQGWGGKTGRATVTMPGIVLIERDIPIENGVLRWTLNGKEMNQRVNNFDYSHGLADTITVTYYAEEQSGRQAAGTVITHGARVPLAPPSEPIPASSNLPTGQTGCLPNESQLFSTDFESGTAGWDFSDQLAWSVVQAEDSKALRGAGHVHAFAGDDWDEVVWRMRVKLSTGRAHLNFHATNGQRYLISFGQDWTQLMRDEPLTEANISHPLEEWHVVEISLLQDVVRIAVDGVLEIEQAETNPLPPGGIWLEVLDTSVVLFDDVHVCEPTD